jgi:uncharacterized radical SAM superfamily Fe-S cluster-containing enzyme
MLFRVWRLALSAYKNPFTATTVMRKLFNLLNASRGKLKNRRLIKSDGRLFWAIASPGWKSTQFDSFIRSELNRIRPICATETSLQTMIFSITARCPLKCDHCYEWDLLSSSEYLSLVQLLQILRNFQKSGVYSIQFSGGEPLSRFDDLVELIKYAKSASDTWILTSGLELTTEKALGLKKAGLTGVVISLDHWDAAIHNRTYRGFIIMRTT